MYTVFVLVIYFIAYIFLNHPKLKTSWVIWASFMIGYSLAYYMKEITNFLNGLL